MNGTRGKVVIGILMFQTMLLIMISCIWCSIYLSRRVVGPPLIPGATAAEQRGPIIEKGWILGLRYRRTVLASHGDSWTGVAARFEGGKSWDEVKAEWSSEFRKTRDDPFDMVVQPEIDLIMTGDRPPTQQQRHNVALFLKAFAEGLKEWR